MLDSESPTDKYMVTNLTIGPELGTARAAGIEGHIARSGSAVMSERGEGDIGGGENGDGAGDEGHFGVDATDTSFITSAKHELGDTPIDEPPTASRTMSVLTLNISDIVLHSPSNIIGTPFATDSAPYEYPFPDNAKATDGGENFRPTSSVASPSLPSLSSRLSLSMSSSSSPHLSSLSTTPPSMSSPPDIPQRYSPTHPKLRTGNPPVPPALVKKRQRWSLNLLRRRSSTSTSAASGTSFSPEAASDGTASERVTYPLRMTRTNEELVARISQHQQRAAEEGNGQVQRSDQGIRG
jgi:hypothetical protein